MAGLKTNERPGTRAVLRYSGVSAYKAREVLDLIRGQDYERATEILEYCDRGAADVIGKILHSAAANARHNDGLEPEEMYVSACFADEGTTLKRWRPRARGRASRIRKRTSHITLILSRLPDDQLARRRARRAAEQSERRARRVAGGLRRPRAGAGAEGRGRRRGAPEPVETAPEASEAMAALEEARALDTTSHHQELEAEAESALDHEHEDDESAAEDGDTTEETSATDTSADDEEEDDDEPGAEATEPTDVSDEDSDEDSDDEPDESLSAGVVEDEGEVSSPEASSDDGGEEDEGEEN